MPLALIRPDTLHAWKGPCLLVVNTRGDCGDDQPLSGLYYREARVLRTLRLSIDGRAPWLCEAAATAPDQLTFTYVHPELTEFGGGGTGQSGDEVTSDDHGIPHRALAAHLTYAVGLRGLEVSLTVVNHSRQTVACEIAWEMGADFADILEAQGNQREQQADVRAVVGTGRLAFEYAHPRLPLRTEVRVDGPGEWRIASSRVANRRTLAPGERLDLRLLVEAHDPAGVTDPAELERREGLLQAWRGRLTRITVPRDREAAGEIIAANVRDFASFPLLEGREDEWLSLQAGVPAYPALFGRDSLTAGWQAALLDRGASLDATLTRLGRLQSDRDFAPREEEPGRIPYQVRTGPLARLDLNPYAAYYADYASPLMFVIALAHLYAWTGDRATIARHWDVARRILDWARTHGDMDGDGYLEYRTRSAHGTKNQGWKDSGDAIVYDDGTPVAPPIATCELQGYWFAAQQLMSVMSVAMGAGGDARDLLAGARALKDRFNRDWWLEDEGCIALAMDPEKRLVGAVTSNAGHCVTSGIISDAHLPPVVGRLFAPDMFSGWGIRTLSTGHRAYDPLSYHRGSVWAVEQATIAFGLRRFGFDARALELARASFDLARLYPEYRIPECVGGYARGETPTPGAYPRANAPQLWNATAFPLLVHTILGLQPVGPLELLVVDPVLPTWLPEVVLRDVRLAGATATLRFWRDRDGASHAAVMHRTGTLRLARQPPPESLSTGLRDRAKALVETLTG